MSSSTSSAKVPTSSFSNSNPSGPALLSVPSYAPRPSITHRYRPDGTQFRPITPLEAIYYHERLDLITHPLIKGLIKWKWDHFAAKRFYIGLALESVFLIAWTCTSLITPFPIRHIYRFPQDIWRCLLWAICIAFLVWQIVEEMFDVSYARQRYEDYLVWESERTNLRLDLISKNKYKSNVSVPSPQTSMKKTDSIVRVNVESGDIEHIVVNEATMPVSPNTTLSNIRSHHSQHHPLPPALPTVIKGKLVEPPPSQAPPIDSLSSSNDATSHLLGGPKKKMGVGSLMDPLFTAPPIAARRRSRFALFAQRFLDRARTRLKSYYMYYSLNNLFDWIIYILCLLTLTTHFFDVSSHTVIRARIHMYIASITVICMWFRFMVFFRTIIISAKTLRSKMIEIKLGELVIMVRSERESLD